MLRQFELLSKESDKLWGDFYTKRKSLDLKLIYWAFSAIQENFKKYEALEHVNININFYGEDMSVSINGYPYESLPEAEELDLQDETKRVLCHVVYRREECVLEETIITRTSTLADLQKAMARYYA